MIQVFAWSTHSHPDFASKFSELNLEWIEKHFKVEPLDRDHLENPKKHIMDPGGEIFFVLKDEEVVGTCALIPHDENGFELAKMAVAPSARGQGIGNTLMEAAINWATAQGAQEIMLVSNTELEAAIALYLKFRFDVTQLGPHPDYERGNIEMVLRI